MKNDVLKGNIPKHMIRLAIPSCIGMLSFTIFNLTDTYFVSQLGTNSLAAMGFTFPIVMIIGSISSGISAGASSMLSRAKGAGDNYQMKRIATDGILLSLVIVALVSIIGLLTIDPLFSALGAEGEVLELVKGYMRIWYLFVVVAMTPPVSDSYMRAIGDMVRPLKVMLMCASINLILDPLLIFGLFGFPELGIEGAAIATVISRAFGMVLTLYFISKHHNLICFKYNNINELLKSWIGIARIGFPSIFTMIMPQFLRTVMTSLAASSGAIYVAAMAASLRIESFPNIFLAGVGMSLIPLIGQNWGAKQYERVFEVRKVAVKFAAIYGAITFVLTLIFAKSIATLFSNDPRVITQTATYLYIMIIGSVGTALTNWMSKAFTTVGKPKFTLAINVIGTGGFIIPMAYLGFSLNGFSGMLLAVSISQILLGIASTLLSYKYLKA